MELYLMQHGKALSEAEDPVRPLSPEGREEIRRSARALAKMGLKFDLILSSTKTRAKETAEIVAEETGYPVEAIKEYAEFKPLGPPEEAIKILKEHQEAQRVFVAGHLPSLAEIASYLLGGEKKVKVHFEFGGLCRLDTDLTPGEAEIVYLLLPSQLALIAEELVKE